MNVAKFPTWATFALGFMFGVLALLVLIDLANDPTKNPCAQCDENRRWYAAHADGGR